MNPSKVAVGKMDQLQRALMIRRTLGARSAAAYMRNTGWGRHVAMYALVGWSACCRSMDLETRELKEALQ